VVVFHEQVIGVIATITGCSLAQADEVRRTMGSPEGQAQVRAWFYPEALGRGYSLEVVERVWDVLRAFASFGFCKAHAAAFALPTYQSAWLKAHHPAAFLAGVLTHDPGMYPKRLILDDARNLGITILGLDVNRSGATYRVECCSTPAARPTLPGLPDGSAHGIRLPLTEVKGISAAEVERIVSGQPYASLSDFWQRASVATPVVENLVLTGGFDGLYGIDLAAGARMRGQATRRDLLLEVADCERLERSTRTGRSRARTPVPTPGARAGRAGSAGTPGPADPAPVDPAVAAAAQSRAPAPVRPSEVQLALALPVAGACRSSGLPEMTAGESVRAELDVLGMDVSQHVLDFYRPMLADLAIVPARDLLSQRSQAEVWVAGVKVATQTPPIRSGRRVVFLTLDDSTGPVDATFFEDAQDPYASTVFGGWLLMVRGVTRRTGPRGISIRATGCWDLGSVHEVWQAGGRAAVAEYIATFPVVDTRRRPAAPVVDIPVPAQPADQPVGRSPVGIGRTAAGGMGQRRRVLVHASGFKQSPYADVKPAGDDPAAVPRAPDRRATEPRTRAPGKLWHASPGSSGW
jgi:error-prone DNA polymerase